MTAAGERALAEAKVVAGEKLETVLASHRKRPLTEQLDYRVYRTLAVGKAKTTAWAEILLGRVFGSRVETEPPRPRPCANRAPPICVPWIGHSKTPRSAKPSEPEEPRR